jgi:hypothetical protein
VWTGKQVVVVGGLIIDQYQALSDGAAFDPAAGTGRRIADRPDPGRVLFAVWTGTEVFTLGTDGIALDPITTAYAYNPTTDSWRKVPLPPSTKAPHDVVWTGKRVLIWQPGGSEPGALFDPATNQWTPMPPSSIAGGVPGGGAAWTGRELAIEGALTPEHGGPVEQRLFLFDPERMAWRVSSPPPSELSGWPFLIPSAADQHVVISGAKSTSGPPPGPLVDDGVLVATGSGAFAFGITSNGSYAQTRSPNAAYLWSR